MKVLVVDDDVVSRMVLMHLVDSCGKFEILEAEDGQEAWEQLERGLRPAILFCDLRMPRLSGMDLLARVRAEPKYDAMPFILASSASERATVDQAGALGAAGYIVKPFEVAHVRVHMAALSSLAAEPALASMQQHMAALPSLPAEPVLATMQRLGIGGERLLLYLGGLHSQLLQAGAEIGQLPAGAKHKEALARLHAGCATLGLSGAAAALGAVGTGSPDVREVERALAGAVRAVLEQGDKVRQMQGAA